MVSLMHQTHGRLFMYYDNEDRFDGDFGPDDDQSDIMRMIDEKTRAKQAEQESTTIFQTDNYSCILIDESCVPESISFENINLKDNIVENDKSIDVYFNTSLFSKMALSDSICAYFFDLSDKRRNKFVNFIL